MTDLLISSSDGTISTQFADTFDYERQTLVVIQIQATDTLVTYVGEHSNSAYAQLIINVIDVNDETPQLRMVSFWWWWGGHGFENGGSPSSPTDLNEFNGSTASWISVNRWKFNWRRSGHRSGQWYNCHRSGYNGRSTVQHQLDVVECNEIWSGGQSIELWEVKFSVSFDVFQKKKFFLQLLHNRSR